MRRPYVAPMLIAATLCLAGPALADHVNVVVDGATVADGQLTFPSVRIDKDGFIVVHRVENGAPVLPSHAGHATVKAGTTENVSVGVEGLAPGTDYVVMLHYDTDGDGTYSFGKGASDVDTPAVTPKNEPWMKAFTAGK